MFLYLCGCPAAMDTPTLLLALRGIRAEVRRFRAPIVTQVSWLHDPYLVLVSCLISLRTKDEVTAKATERLFALATTPEKMILLSPKRIEKAIYPAGFYRTKARTIIGVSSTLLERHGGKVPDTMEELLALKGVGRKTANLVLGLGFGKPAICVDTHVHRISNRLGYVKTKTPEKTEFALREKLPRRHWIEVNDLLVNFCQHICVPVSPRCSICPVSRLCERVGVTVHR